MGTDLHLLGPKKRRSTQIWLAPWLQWNTLDLADSDAANGVIGEGAVDRLVEGLIRSPALLLRRALETKDMFDRIAEVTDESSLQ